MSKRKSEEAVHNDDGEGSDSEASTVPARATVLKEDDTKAAPAPVEEQKAAAPPAPAEEQKAAAPSAPAPVEERKAAAPPPAKRHAGKKRAALDLIERSKLDLRRARLRNMIQQAGMPTMKASSENAFRKVYVAVMADLLHGASQLARHADRKTVQSNDVAYALHCKFGTNLYTSADR